jgi:glutathione S-transferase
VQQSRSSPFLAGDEISIADLYLAPIFAYIALTPHLEEFAGLPGVGEVVGAHFPAVTASRLLSPDPLPAVQASSRHHERIAYADPDDHDLP